MLRRRRLLSIRPRRCSGRSKFGGFLYSCVSRRWRYDAADFVLCGLAAARGCRTDCCPTLAQLVSHRPLALSFLLSWLDS